MEPTCEAYNRPKSGVKTRGQTTGMPLIMSVFSPARHSPLWGRVWGYPRMVRIPPSQAMTDMDLSVQYLTRHGRPWTKPTTAKTHSTSPTVQIQLDPGRYARSRWKGSIPTERTSYSSALTSERFDPGHCLVLKTSGTGALSSSSASRSTTSHSNECNPVRFDPGQGRCTLLTLSSSAGMAILRGPVQCLHIDDDSVRISSQLEAQLDVQNGFEDGISSTS